MEKACRDVFPTSKQPIKGKKEADKREGGVGISYMELSGEHRRSRSSHTRYQRSNSTHRHLSHSLLQRESKVK